MLENLRKPFFFLAIALSGVVVLIEIGATAFLGLGNEAAKLASTLDAPTPGYGIPYLALLDGLVLFTVLLIAASLFIPERFHGRTQGIITLIVSLLALLAAIWMIFAAIVMLAVMVVLLTSPIFGTVAYFAVYANFDTAGARIALSLLMALKLGFAGCLVLAQQRFLQNKGLVLIILTSLLATFIISVLHSFFPGFLVSITDNIAGIIAALLAAIWAVAFLVGSLISVTKAVH